LLSTPERAPSRTICPFCPHLQSHESMFAFLIHSPLRRKLSDEDSPRLLVFLWYYWLLCELHMDLSIRDRACK
jgi:hypothetical protein